MIKRLVINSWKVPAALGIILFVTPIAVAMLNLMFFQRVKWLDDLFLGLHPGIAVWGLLLISMSYGIFLTLNKRKKPVKNILLGRRSA